MVLALLTYVRHNVLIVQTNRLANLGPNTISIVSQTGEALPNMSLTYLCFPLLAPVTTFGSPPSARLRALRVQSVLF